MHAVSVRFLNSRPTRPTGHEPGSYYQNFYYGKDPSKWVTGIHPYRTLRYQDLYEGIDLVTHARKQGMKYEFHLEAGADPSRIALQYEGTDDLRIREDGSLQASTSLSGITEAAPVAYQMIDGQKREIPCRFALEDSTVRFAFPESYDPRYPLVIDPEVVFATYTGSTADNWGNTATYDDDGHLYAGGIAFAPGYPTTTGAYQENFGGGNPGPYKQYPTDMSITKYSPDGSQLVYSTYLGGSSNETPHSLVANDEGELFIFGTTSSLDFPVTPNAYDTTFNGGNPRLFTVVEYNNGTDIVVARLSDDGTSLDGSTYFGGSENDGINMGGTLNYNYGDVFRGEINLTGNGNCLVATTTRSDDLPVTSDAIQTTHGGKQDACVFQLSGDLSSLLWSTYLGGDEHDAGYSAQFDSKGNIFVSGGTLSDNFPTTPGAHQPSQPGGADGFISQFTATGDSLKSSSYVGTSDYDQSYFVQVDTSDAVFLLGQTKGNFPVTGGTYTNPNSGQFVRKYTNDLSASPVSTVFGTGSGYVDISPSAFLVSKCNNIFISGWGGQVNQSNGRASNSTTTGLPISGNAYQSSTDGSDFYLMVLGEDASVFKYGSFFGGGTSHEHVDGGTSRFDKNGIVYQAVCGGCGGNSDFPTTPGAWSQINDSWNCNLASIKFDLSNLTADIGLNGPLYTCTPDTFHFENTSHGGVQYKWYFGDGDSSSAYAPSHYYADTGTYDVTLIVTDSLSCVLTDTAHMTVAVLPPEKPQITDPPAICTGDSVQLEASNAFTYHWSPRGSLTNDDIPDPIAFPDSSQTYQVITTGCENDSAASVDTNTVDVMVHQINSSATGDTGICIYDSTRLQAVGGTSYSWRPGGSLSDSTAAAPWASPLSDTSYTVTIIDSNGCRNLDTVDVSVWPLPTVTTSNDTAICLGETMELNASGGDQYAWSPTTSLIEPYSPDPIAAPLDTTTYTVTVTDSNQCRNKDSVEIQTLSLPNIQAYSDTTVCRGDTAGVSATGGMNYTWSPDSSLTSDNTASTQAFPTQPTYYVVTGTDSLGCQNKDSVQIGVHSLPVATTSPDTFICIGESVQLQAGGGTGYSWDPATSLDRPNDPDPTATPSNTTLYTVEVTDQNQCQDTAQVEVKVDINPPQPQAYPDTVICIGDNTRLHATGGHEFQWSPATGLDSTTSANPLAVPAQDQTYSVDITNGCGTETRQVTIQVSVPVARAYPDTTICKGDSTHVHATGGTDYVWEPDSILSAPQSASTLAFPETNQEVRVTVTDPIGCKDNDTILVRVKELPFLDAGKDEAIEYGSTITLHPAGEGPGWLWWPDTAISCTNCRKPEVRPLDETTYYVRTTDTLGCETTDSLTVVVSGALYVPNAFSPNGDGDNDVFRAEGTGINHFELMVFNRWGQKLFETNDIEKGWDGTVDGELAKSDVYVWKIRYSEDYKPNIKKTETGHVTLVR